MQGLPWFKFYSDFFDDRRVIYLRSLEGGSEIILFYQLLMTQAAKCNAGGRIYFTADMPFTSRLFSVVFGMDEQTVIRAESELTKLGFIHKDADGFHAITAWDEEEQYTPVTAVSEPSEVYEVDEAELIREYNRNRKRLYRLNKSLSETTQDDVPDIVPDIVPDKNENVRDKSDLYKDIDIDKEKEKEKEEKEKEAEAENIARVCGAFNDMAERCHTAASAPFKKIEVLSPEQRTAINDSVAYYGADAVIRCIGEAERNPFFQGKNPRNWCATFDWLINKNNVAKVLNGNYDSKAEPENGDVTIVHSFSPDEFAELAIARGFD